MKRFAVCKYDVPPRAPWLGPKQGLLLQAFATETVWALAAPPSPQGAARLRARKGRADTQPFQLLCASGRVAARFAAPAQAGVSAAEGAAWQALHTLWPGPLTLVVSAHPDCPTHLCAPDGSVGLRVPAWPPAQRLLAAQGGVLLATSLNRAGEPSMVCYAEAKASRLADLVWQGPRSSGEASTVVDLRTHRILRRGRLVAEVEKRLSRLGIQEIGP